MVVFQIVALVVLLVVAVVFVGLFMVQSRQTHVLADLVKEADGDMWCQKLPENVCSALPVYCSWEKGDSEMQDVCKNRV